MRTSSMPWLNAATASSTKPLHPQQLQQQQQQQQEKDHPIDGQRHHHHQQQPRKANQPNNGQQKQQRQQNLHEGPAQGRAKPNPRQATSKDRHVCDMHMLQSWVWYLMAGLVTPLIRAAFYVTETEPCKNQVRGYRWVDVPGKNAV
eukprot:1156087-Pelagomonas_calceolata.AAC.4